LKWNSQSKMFLAFMVFSLFKKITSLRSVKWYLCRSSFNHFFLVNSNIFLWQKGQDWAKFIILRLWNCKIFIITLFQYVSILSTATYVLQITTKVRHLNLINSNVRFFSPRKKQGKDIISLLGFSYFLDAG
jgi:hypothetical protein